MNNVGEGNPQAPRGRWMTRTVVGIILATFFSDVSHEMCTAVLPLYLATVGLGPAALGLIEGVADFLVSISKLGGGFVGHHVKRKRPWATVGYLVTTLGTWGIAFTGSLAALLTLRSAAWVGRGFRSPLRDYILADAVDSKYFGRAYGLEQCRGERMPAFDTPVPAEGSDAIRRTGNDQVIGTMGGRDLAAVAAKDGRATRQIRICFRPSA